MTTEQTAQQLELAAQILRTGHPWGYRHIAGSRHKYNTPIEVVADGNFLSPLLATPPDNRPLHNPDNLTAEQVGVGYRLLLTSEKPNTHVKLQEKWKVDEWVPSGVIYADPLTPVSNTYRLPLSVPWPEPADPYAELKAAQAAGKVIEFWSEINRKWESNDVPMAWCYPPERYRIKPEPAFQLLPPPPGMRWHREDGWTADDLPIGYRPHVAGEESGNGTQQRFSGTWVRLHNSVIADAEENLMRTTRPLTFNHAGKTWTYHRPGDPMPCDGEARIEIVCHEGRTEQEDGIKYLPRLARNNIWEKTLGWRYADEKKTVPLSPEDVRCGDEIMDEYQLRRCVITVGNDGVSLGGEGFIAYIHLTGRKIRRRDSNEFVPCSKQIPA